MKGRLLIISNRMPVTVESREGKYSVRQSSGGLVSAITAYLQGKGVDKYSGVIWAGVPDVSKQLWETHVDAHHQHQYHYFPIHIEDEMYELYYNGFANSVIWPLFHYFPSFVDCNPAFFEAYLDVNRRFAENLSREVKPDDVVWIHDYQLIPLAGMLRELCPKLTIGFFLHIPFPSHELLRMLPRKWQTTLLEGLLGADVVGFHTVDYRQHFLTAVQTLLKESYDGEHIPWQNRKVKAGIFPISIDFEYFNKAYQNDEVKALRSRYQEVAAPRKLIFSVDRLDYTKGVFNRLKAYELFLEQHPEYRDRVVFALVVVPSRDSILKYAERKKIIDEYIGYLNSKFGNITWQPVLYQYGHLAFNDLIAHYTSADLALITPLRDGMNLVAKEFVASRADLRGVLVLSEMAGAAREMRDALIINPNDLQEICDMIKLGLEMPYEEQSRRMQTMRQRIMRYDVKVWADDFFRQLWRLKSEQLAFEVKFLDSLTRLQLLEDFASAQGRLLLLDYDGTLISFSSHPSLAVPDDSLLNTLRELAEKPNTVVYIISGRDSHTLESWFAGLPIGLVAEHGAKIKNAGEDWQSFTASDGKWKAKALDVMESFVARCPDSFTEVKEYSVAWHYRNSEPQQAELLAKELAAELKNFGNAINLDVITGNKVIEMRHRNLNKGIAAQQLVSSHPHEFLLCIGDDKTDEDMFHRLNNSSGAYTIKVGTDASLARFNLHNPSMVKSLLESICVMNDSKSLKTTNA